MPNAARALTRADSMLKPEIRQFLDIMDRQAARYPACSTVPIERYRQIAEHIREPFYAGGPDMVRTEDRLVPTARGEVRIRLHYPVDAPALPAFFYLHGGGWVMFSLKTHGRLMREYAARAGVCVVGIDYSLAPECTFPVPLDETAAVLSWCADHAAELGLDADRFALGGDSAGGNMSLASAIRLRDEGRPGLLKALVLNYGAFDTTVTGRSVEQYGGGDFLLEAEEMRGFWSSYLAGSDTVPVLAAPARARLDGLPPAFMAISDHDILYDENILMRDRLQAAGNATQANIYAGTVHGFMESMSLGGVADEALDDTCAWLKKVLQTNDRG